MGLAILACSLPSHGQVTSTYTVTAAESSVKQMLLNAVTLNAGSAASLGAGGNTFYYVGVRVVPTVTGVYTLGQISAPIDTVMLVYNGAFDPLAPTPPSAFNDDGGGWAIGSQTVVACGGGAGLCPRISGYSMVAGTPYYLIASTYGYNDASLGLPVGFAADGPGILTFSADLAAPATVVSSIPALQSTAQMALVLLVGFAGILHLRRARARH